MEINSEKSMLCTDATGTHEAKKAVWKSGRVDVEAIRNEDLRC